MYPKDVIVALRVHLNFASWDVIVEFRADPSVTPRYI